MQGAEFASTGALHLIAEERAHWFLLSIDFTQGVATHWDPCPERTVAAAEVLLQAACCIVGQTVSSLQTCKVDDALGERCCGAVALCHLMLAAGVLCVGSRGLVDWAQDSAAKLDWGPALHYGAGGLSAADMQQLTELLLSKGVPEPKVKERITEALAKVGQRKLEEGLHARNPWAVLKAVATGTAQPFRWLKADELEAQIRAKADNRFGTAANEARGQKTKAKKGAPKQVTPQLDPKNLVLIEGTFVTDDGTAVPSLNLEDVAVNAHGVAVCSAQQALPFLTEAASISVEPLAVVTTAPLQEVQASSLTTQNLRFPAIYGPTSEPILAAGTLAQLGDSKVLLAANRAKAEQARTGVAKVNVFKDQWTGSEAFTQTPVKCLQKSIPLLNLCKGQGCGADCPKFHANIDEVPTEPFQRFGRANSRRRTGQRQLRTGLLPSRCSCGPPASAVDSLQQVSTAGVYIEPREFSNTTGPNSDYAVIWLPGLDYQAAVRQDRPRTCTHPTGT